MADGGGTPGGAAADLFDAAGAPASVRRRGGRPGEPPPGHAHRARLRRRFLDAGPEALLDHEILELVLFRAIPRRDVAPLARRLLATFGDLADVVSAPSARLAEVQGMGDASIAEIRIVEAAAHRLARARVMGRPAIAGWSALLDYCRTVMAHRGTEQLRCLHLDRRNGLIADEVLGEGTIDHVPAYPREIAKRALALDAAALILVHNHPSGDPAPSRADVAMTREVAAALATVGVTLHDHVIVGRGREASFRALGLL
jgi:DNA repair protein RadC